MMGMSFRKLKRILLFTIIVSVLFVTEFFVYEFCYLKWHFKYSHEENLKESVSVLLVGDPQIIGVEYENQLLGPFIRWDADRYLQNGYKRAIRFTNAEVIIFMGDIFDEGEIASDADYDNYVSRFSDLFLTHLNENVKTIIIPGDNDVGGEFPKQRLKALVDRFRKKFKITYPNMETIRNINFVSTDITRDTGYEETVDFIKEHADDLQFRFNVLLNHDTVPDDLWGYFSMVFTAHTHLSKYQQCENCKDNFRKITAQDLNNYTVIQRNLPVSSDSSVGFVVPTCSYRMGVPYPGYGHLTISTDGHISYKVLWLPFRFHCLYMLGITVTILLLSFPLSFCKFRCRHR